MGSRPLVDHLEMLSFSTVQTQLPDTDIANIAAEFVIQIEKVRPIKYEERLNDC